MREVARVGAEVIDWSEPSAVVVAPRLLGWELVSGRTVGRIVEVEAYEPDDPASHTFRGKTKRNATMFGRPGRLYAYLIYGMHICANVVVGPPGRGAAVLIRALEPVAGLDVMAERRGSAIETNLCSGPGKLCQSLGISLGLDGIDLVDPTSQVHLRPPTSTMSEVLISGPRIGITKAVEQPWRFGLADSPHLSRPFPAGPG